MGEFQHTQPNNWDVTLEDDKILLGGTSAPTALASGTVNYIGTNTNHDIVVMIGESSANQVAYTVAREHVSSLQLSKGDMVEQGQDIFNLSGNSDYIHTSIEIIENGRVANPEAIARSLFMQETVNSLPEHRPYQDGSIQQAEQTPSQAEPPLSSEQNESFWRIDQATLDYAATDEMREFADLKINSMATGIQTLRQETADTCRISSLPDDITISPQTAQESIDSVIKVAESIYADSHISPSDFTQLKHSICTEVNQDIREATENLLINKLSAEDLHSVKQCGAAICGDSAEAQGIETDSAQELASPAHTPAHAAPAQTAGRPF